MNENRIYKNYYLYDRTYVNIENANIIKNVDSISYTDEIKVWPKTSYDSDKALEIYSKEKKDKVREIEIITPNISFINKNVLSIAIDGYYPCDVLDISLYSNDYYKTYKVNFFPDRWIRLLIDVDDYEHKDNLTKIKLTFSSMKGFDTENEHIYIGEIYFGNILDFQFEHDNTKLFKTNGLLKYSKGLLNYSFKTNEELIFPEFEKARYSVLNSLIFIKDTIKLTCNSKECNEYRIYIKTNFHKEYSLDYSHSFKTKNDGLETVLIKIDDLIKDEAERLLGLKLVPLSNGSIDIYDVSFIQEKDFILDDIANDFLKKEPVKVLNPYKFDIPNIIYNVKDFGAKGDFYTNDTYSFNKALLKAKETGGVVLVPKGRYVITHIEIYSNTELRLEEDSYLIQSENKDYYDYDVAYEHDNINYNVEWAHNFLVHNKPLIYSNHQENIKITGKGKIRMGDTGAERLMGGYPYYDIHCNALIHIVPICLNFCKNIEVSDITISRANSYHLFLTHAQNTFINNTKFYDPRCLSGDGIGLASGRNVLISNILFVSNDDGITMNPGYDDPRGHNSYWDQTPEENNTIENIEICHSYINSSYGSWGKAIAFIPWGKCASNQEWSQTRFINVHDCILKGGNAIGTWCDDPYHGKVPFDNSELDDCSPISDITLMNNTYIGPCSLMEIKVTNMVSDCNLHSTYEIVNGKFKDGMCNWKSDTNVKINYQDECAYLKENDNLYEIIYSRMIENVFSFKVKGKGILFIDDKEIAFETKDIEEITISREYVIEKNIKVGIKALLDTIVYEVKRK